MILKPEVVLDEAERARRAPQQDEGDADDHRRHGERQIDDGLQDALPTKPVARQNECGGDAEDDVERNHDRDDEQ